MRLVSNPVGPGQESVWSYPRPAVAQQSNCHIVIKHAGQTIAETRSAVRTIETSHPPSYYIPPADIAPGLLRRAGGSSFCEWKGAAIYWDVLVGDSCCLAWAGPIPVRRLPSPCCATMSLSMPGRSIVASSMANWSRRRPVLSMVAGSPAGSLDRSRARPGPAAGERMKDDPRPWRSRGPPAGKACHLGQFGRLADGRRPRMRYMLLTPAIFASPPVAFRTSAMKLGQMVSLDAGDLLHPGLTKMPTGLRERADHMPPAQLQQVLAWEGRGPGAQQTALA